MTPAAQQAFTKMVAQYGLLYPATSVRPQPQDKARLRRLKRKAQRRWDGKELGAPRTQTP